MAKKKIVLSSKEEQQIEKAYIQTGSGKAMFTLTLVSCVALLVGLLIETYKVSATGTEFINPNNPIYVYSNYLFMWGACVALICMVFYIKFALDYKAKGNTRTRTTAPAKPKTTKKVVKKAEPVKKTVTKTTKTAPKKAVKKTTKK